MRWWYVLLVAGGMCCELEPTEYVRDKSPGDNYYKVVINGNVERYAPEQRYVVTLVGSRTHDVVQQFTKFKMSLEPLDPEGERSPRKQGQFQLFADTLTAFDEECSNSVVEADDLPKTEVLVMWKAPPTGSGCVLIKAMVYENESSWFAEDGQLTKRVCEDTSLSKLDCCACDDAKYKVTFEGLWSEKTHPKDFPREALWLTHFSDVIGATHPSGFSFWGEGEIATDGFRSLAEWGSVGLLERELRQRGSLLRSIVKASGLWFPKVNSNTSAAFTVDRRRHLLSLASMFGPSPDWVVGVNGLDLCQMDCSWVQNKVVDLYPYDAGTDSGVSYMSPNVETVPRERMFKITPMYPEDPRGPFYSMEETPIQPLARIYIQREEVVKRQCDEQTLSMIATEEAENTQTTNKPECSVSEWSEWSPCSVSCGKGLRTRNRSYLNEIKAKKNNCDRQIIGREMCVADIAECPATPPTSENVIDTEVEQPIDPELCATSSWSLWSECSVTCGIGFQTKRRSFINHMGNKKCPLVSIEENRKCMEPQCTEIAVELVDPSCPTTDWSGWSPCSATCGRGVELRTRLLLVSAEQQNECSQKVELVQQRTCKDRESCDIDMLMAKEICMQQPEQGPCRGMYTRWAFVSLKGKCEQFHYGGCRGNRNNFIFKEDCDNACGIILGGGQSNSTNDASSNQVLETVTSPRSPVSCELSPWSEWSECSVTCGAGFQEKSRTIVVQPSEGGMACPSRLNRRRRCYRRCIRA